jgi:hypothetical protein
MEIIQGSGVEVKKGDDQVFELDEENEKRHLRKMRVSQNYDKRWGDRNCTSTLLKIGVKIGVLKRYLPANH